MFARHPSMRANFEKLQLPSKELLDCTKEDFMNLSFSVRHTGEILGASALFRLHSFLPSSSPLILLFLVLRHPSYSFLEWRGRGTTGRLGRRFGSGGAATTPGTALGPRGCHPRGRPGLSRAPARTPQHPKTPSTGPGDAGVSGIPEGTVGRDREGRGKFGGQEVQG